MYSFLVYFCTMIVVTGAAGFIGSCLISKLNSFGKKNLILVDDFSCIEKNKNLVGKSFEIKIERSKFIKWFTRNASDVTEVYHIGARTDTAEVDITIFEELNFNYSKFLWQICAKNKIPFVYASSAATYGIGEYQFKDNHKNIEKLRPLNEYGISKNNFDKWVLNQIFQQKVNK